MFKGHSFIRLRTVVVVSTFFATYHYQHCHTRPVVLNRAAAAPLRDLKISTGAANF